MQFILQLTASAAISQFSISYYARVSATTGSDTDIWSYSLNNGSTWASLSPQPATITTSWAQRTVSVDVEVASGSSIWFRNQLTAATANNINADFDTIQVNAVNVVPEPVNLALGVFGLVIGGTSLRRWVRERRQSAAQAA
jgi:hypothetical protein